MHLSTARIEHLLMAVSSDITENTQIEKLRDSECCGARYFVACQLVLWSIHGSPIWYFGQFVAIRIMNVGHYHPF